MTVVQVMEEVAKRSGRVTLTQQEVQRALPAPCSPSCRRLMPGVMSPRPTTAILEDAGSSTENGLV